MLFCTNEVKFNTLICMLEMILHDSGSFLNDSLYPPSI